MKKTRRKLLTVVLILTMVLTMSQAAFADSTGLADGDYKIEVSTGETMFKVVDAVLKVKDGKMTAVVTLSGTGYTYLYAGQVNDSNTDVLDTVAEEDRIPVKAIVTNDEGKEQAQYEIPVASLDTPLAFGSFSANKQVWYARTMTFKADTLTPVAQDPAPVDPVEPEDPKNDSDQTSQDNGTTDTNVPKTGDNMGLGLMMLLVVGGAGSAAVFYKKRNVA